MRRTQTADSHALVEHISRRAGDYFPDLAGEFPTVKIASVQQHRFSTGFLLTVKSGERRRDLFAKAPKESPAQRTLLSNESVAADRPRLVPTLPVEFEARREYESSRAMQGHFATIGDCRIGAPNVLDTVPLSGDAAGGETLHAIIFETINAPTLARRLRTSWRQMYRSSAAPLTIAFENSGHWLRALHDMPAGDVSEARLATREELIGQFARFTDFLQRVGGSGIVGDGLLLELERHCQSHLPPQLPLVTAHGDFGSHNLFAHDDGRVVGFDTLAYWRTSRLEDIAYFLLLLENPPPLFLARRTVTRPQQTLELRRAFLHGYFQGEVPPAPELHLYELLVAMDKWASVVHSAQRANGPLRVVKRIRKMVQVRGLTSRIRSCLQKLRTVTSTPSARRPAWELASWEPAP